MQQVGLGVALSPWTDETDKDIQERLGLNRDEFRYAKKQAMPWVQPLWVAWLDDLRS